MAFKLLHIDKLTDSYGKAGRCDANIFYWKYDKNVEKSKLWEWKLQIKVIVMMEF